jgi:hypothetical protein
VRRRTLIFKKKSYEFLDKFHCETEEEWVFTQAHFDAAIFRKMPSDYAMLDALQNCVQKKKSAGFFTFQHKALTSLKEAFHKYCEIASLRWTFVDQFKTDEEKPNYSTFVESLDKGFSLFLCSKILGIFDQLLIEKKGKVPQSIIETILNFLVEEVEWSKVVEAVSGQKVSETSKEAADETVEPTSKASSNKAGRKSIPIVKPVSDQKKDIVEVCFLFFGCAMSHTRFFIILISF